MDDDRRSRLAYGDPPAAALSPAVRDALTALLTPRPEVQEARVSQMTETFDGVEVARRLVLGLSLTDPPEGSGDPRVEELMTDLIQPLREIGPYRERDARSTSRDWLACDALRSF